MEIRAALFGRGLMQSGRWRTVFVVSDFGQAFTTRHEGIEFYIYQLTFRRYGRNIFPRFRKRKLFSRLNIDRQALELLWQIPLVVGWMTFPALAFPRFWRALGADIVCCFGSNSRTAEVIADCRRAGIKTILYLASDEDLSKDFRPGDDRKNPYGMPNWMGHYALINASAILVQTERQQQLLLERFGRHGEIIRNPVDVSPSDPESWPDRSTRNTILWIGRAEPYNKRPLHFLELARRCPELPFVMIANKTDADVFNTLLRERPDNLTIIERVPHSEIWDYYRHARVFVSTSVYEGFPNTFLQCAVAGVPIASLQVDPDGFLARHGCGICSDGNMAHLADSVRLFWKDAEIAERFAFNAHRHVLANHNAEGRIDEFAACIRRTMAAHWNNRSLTKALFWKRYPN